jgi:HK97 family phage prohead protease
MKYENKHVFGFKVDDADEAKGIIRGFASTFGNIDLGDDVVDPGAFKKTLKESKGIVPILADHDPTKQIGWNVRAEENEKGLLIEGQLNMKSPLALERYELAKTALKLGGKMGISIGYGVIKAEPDKERPALRRLKELKLYEYSLVTFPMNTEAMVTAAKSWALDNTMEGLLEQIKIRAKALGKTPEEIAIALSQSTAAGGQRDSSDPLDEQSQEHLKRIIKLFER